MKLCVSTYSLSRWRRENNKSLEQSLQWIADNGVKAVEFSGLDSKGPAQPEHLKRATQIRKRCEKLGLEIAGYSVPGELLTGPAQQRKTIEILKTSVDIAAELGVKTMRHDVTRGFGSYKRYKGPKTFAAALKIIVPAIRKIADHGEKRGVKTSLENHGFYMQAATRVEKLIKTVNHPNYGLTMDMGNFLCVNDDPTKAVARLAKYAVMVHAKDFHVKPKKAVPGPGWIITPTPIAIRGAICGHGELDIPAQLKHVKKAGYDRYLSLEFEGMEEPTKGILHGLDYLRKAMDQVGIKHD